MARRKPGLGRGLAELLGEPVAATPARDCRATMTSRRSDETASDAALGAAAAAPESTLVDLPVSSIRPNPRQPRRSMDAEGLQELARSIASAGVVQPIIVRPAGDGYELVAGERRWRAAQMAGFSVVPAILRAASDIESLELALIENVVRQQLNPLDEALALHMLLEDLGVTQECLARMVMPFSRSRSMESITRSATTWLARNDPVWRRSASTSVVLPWSTWATIATLRRSARIASAAGSVDAVSGGAMVALGMGGRGLASGMDSAIVAQVRCRPLRAC